MRFIRLVPEISHMLAREKLEMFRMTECIKHVNTDLSWVFLNIPLEGAGETHGFAWKVIPSWEMAPFSENPAEMTVFVSLGCLENVRDRERGQESSWCTSLVSSLLDLALGCPLALVLWHCRRLPIHYSLCSLLALVGGILTSQGAEWGRRLHSTPHSCCC